MPALDRLAPGSVVRSTTANPASYQHNRDARDCGEHNSLCPEVTFGLDSSFETVVPDFAASTFVLGIPTE